MEVDNMPRVFDREVLRKRITDGRESQGMNQATLAEKAGVTPAAISQIEKGTRVPTIPVLHQIAHVLGVSLDYLTGKTDKSKIVDLLQHNDIITLFRGLESLEVEDKKMIKKQIEFLKSQRKGRKGSDATN
jgi:transcriptional regulator with XRE-family HTH domain